MAQLTKEMERQLESLLDAAAGGLPAYLKDFIGMSVSCLRTRVVAFPALHTRSELQAYIDTLIDLIDTKVNSR
jgi:hypothetical protein